MSPFSYKLFACAILAFINLPVIGFSQDTKKYTSSDKAFSISYPEDWKVNKDRRFEFSIYQGTGLLIPTMLNIEVRKKAEGYENADISAVRQIFICTIKN